MPAAGPRDEPRRIFAQSKNGVEEELALPTYTSVATTALHGPLFRRIFRLLRDEALCKIDGSAFRATTASELEEVIPFRLGMNGIRNEDSLLELLKNVIEFTPRLSHPLSLSSHSNGLDPYGIVAEFISCVMSAPVVSYFFAPVFTLMEEELKARFCALCGWSGGSGIFCSGDAFANLLALRMAIHHFFPDVRRRGLRSIGIRPAIFVSTHGHSDWENAAAITGLGSEACFRVSTDSAGRICPEALHLSIERSIGLGFKPFVVVATAGTNHLGAIDPISKLADLCQNFGLWMHVDGAYGASYLLSEGQTGRLSGVGRSDSLSWSPSGMLGAPSCSTLLVTPHAVLPRTTFGLHALIVYDQTPLYDGKWDNGDSHIQTCRRPDVLKPWLMWKAKGQDGLAAQIRTADEIANWTLAQIKGRPNFRSILELADTPRIAFYYQRSNPPLLSTREIARSMQRDGVLDLDIVSLRSHPDCFSMSLNNPMLTRTHVTYVLDTIEYYGSGGHGIKPKLGESKISPGRTLDAGFWDELFDLILEKGLFFQTAKARAQPAFTFRKPEDLLQLFDFRLEECGKTNSDVLDILKNVIRFSLHQSHLHFRSQLLAAGLDPYAIMADLVTSVASSPMLSPKDSALYRRMEEEVIKSARKKLGFTGEGDGMVTPGGSVAINVAIYVARAVKFPATLISGQFETNLVLFMSENGHYGKNKAAILQGYGLENCILVKADGAGRMMPTELLKAILKCRNEGGTPIMVTATAGTSGSGVYDPLDAIAKICRKENLWLHVDGSLGASLIFSDNLAAKYLQGIQHADSVNFNPHKMFGCPLEMSVLLFKNERVLEQAFKLKGGNYSAGFQSDRRPNILKFWFLWKAKGSRGLGKHVDHIYKLSRFGAEELKRRSDRFIIWKHPIETPALLFHYVPLKLRNMDRNSAQFQEAVNRVAFPLMALLARSRVLNVGALREADGAVLNKMVLMSSGVQPKDILSLLDLIDHYGKDMQISVGPEPAILAMTLNST